MRPCLSMTAMFDVATTHKPPKIQSIGKLEKTASGAKVSVSEPTMYETLAMYEMMTTIHAADSTLMRLVRSSAQDNMREPSIG